MVEFLGSKFNLDDFGLPLSIIMSELDLNITLTIKGKDYKASFVVVKDIVNQITGRDRFDSIMIKEQDLDADCFKLFASWFKEVVDHSKELKGKSSYSYVVPYRYSISKGVLHGCFISEHEFNKCFIMRFDYMGSVEYNYENIDSK